MKMKELRKTTTEELRDILIKHYLWLLSEGEEGTRADLSGMDLRNTNLSMTVLVEANLRNANLEGADLRGADLRKAALVGTCLRHTNLCKTDLRDANMMRADLHKADLKFANLKYAYLRGANIEMADLRWADLRGASLYRATLPDACLSGANFKEADLREASVRGADLCDADLSLADLRGTELVDAVLDGAIYFVPSVCPKEGPFIAWKKALGSECDNCCPYVIVKLLIPEDARRSSGTSRKCRASKATVLDIQTLGGKSLENVIAYSNYDFNFIYEIGKTVTPDSFDGNRFNECSSGIHFFIDRQEAVDYCM